MNTKKLTLLHSNDMHGDFLAENLDKNLIGGVGLLSGYVSKVREQEENVIYAIAGDMFRGSVIDSEYKGVSTINLMNAIAPDIVTIGNHEIDYGIAHLLFIEKCAQFPIINANLYIKSNNVRLFEPCRVIKVGGLKVLFIGVITEKVMNAAQSDDIGAFIDTAEAATEVGKICDAYNSIDIDFTVLLTHIGFEEDKLLASLLKPEWGVDVIIGGHSHTIMEEPFVVNGIPIVQAHTGTDVIGRFDIEIDTDKNRMDSYSWSLITINNEIAEPDKQIEKMLLEYKAETDIKYERVISRLARKLTHPERTEETELGNMVSDIFMESLGVDVMMTGSGSIRLDEIGPVVTYGSLVACFPYDEPLYMVKVTGQQFRKMVHYMQRDEAFTGETEYYQFSRGVKMIYSKSEHAFHEFSLNGEPVPDDDSRMYSIGLQNFHMINFEDNFNISIEEVSKNMKPRALAISTVAILEEYFSVHNRINAKVEGRNLVVD